MPTLQSSEDNLVIHTARALPMQFENQKVFCSLSVSLWCSQHCTLPPFMNTNATESNQKTAKSQNTCLIQYETLHTDLSSTLLVFLSIPQIYSCFFHKLPVNIILVVSKAEDINIKTTEMHILFEQSHYWPLSIPSRTSNP